MCIRDRPYSSRRLPPPPRARSARCTRALALSTGVGGPGVQGLRTFRIFRLFKLAKAVPSIRKVFVTLSQSISSVSYLAVLLCLVILIFILLGMELFGGFYPRPELNYTQDKFPAAWEEYKITWDDDFPSRYHFDDLGNAFLSICFRFAILAEWAW